MLLNMRNLHHATPGILKLLFQDSLSTHIFSPITNNNKQNNKTAFSFIKAATSNSIYETGMYSFTNKIYA